LGQKYQKDTENRQQTQVGSGDYPTWDSF
jgi:hypothetical protein